MLKQKMRPHLSADSKKIIRVTWRVVAAVSFYLLVWHVQTGRPVPFDTADIIFLSAMAVTVIVGFCASLNWPGHNSK